MFARTLAVHWKTLRWPLAALALVSFAAPLLWAAPDAWLAARLPADLADRFWLTGAGGAGDAHGLFPILAAAVGAVVALGVWYWDHRADHVLALSLPVTRRRYVLVKFGAGAALLAVVAAAFFLGALLFAVSLDLPDWLHARPAGLAFKFLLATLVVYALIFALAAGTIPTALRTLTVIGVAAVVVPALPVFLDVTLAELALRTAELVGHVLYDWLGPFAILGGDWSLIGV